METAIVGILGLIVWVESMAILELYTKQRRLENIVNDLADIIQRMLQQPQPGRIAPLRILDGGARK